MSRTNNIFLVLILIVVSLALIFALIVEFKLGHKPCSLCLYERIPYIVSILLITQLLFFKKFEKVILLILFLTFLIGSILAFYHFGIEQGFFRESFTCKNLDSLKMLSKEQLLETLNENYISCKNVSFRVFGLSLAAINTILSIILSGFFLRLFLKYKMLH